MLTLLPYAVPASCITLFVLGYGGRRKTPVKWVFLYLFGILPYLSGGFHTFSGTVTAGVLLLWLLRCRKTEQLPIQLNRSSMAILLLFAGYCVTPLWAADKGMAVFGFLRYLPVLLLAVSLMQLTWEEKLAGLSLLPYCGAVMTVISCVLWLIPTAQAQIVVNGRLSGFLQYPNAFAAFLVTGIAVLGTDNRKTIASWLTAGILGTGIFLSGSRTGLALLAVTLIGILWIRGRKKPVAASLAVFCGAVLTVTVLALQGNTADVLGRDVGSLLVRLLYYKDALPVILKHPFGLGYLGYRALEATFQTSRYTVAFVHSGLLQMMLDAGWIPPALLVLAVAKTLSAKKTPASVKLVLLITGLHSMLDFHLEFFLFWGILVTCLDFEAGKRLRLKISAFVGWSVAALLFSVCLWLGSGDLMYHMGKYPEAMAVTPFHTDAAEAMLKELSDPEELDAAADRILARKPSSSLAYNAKANAALAGGDVPEMIRRKEQAIRHAPYAVEEYCDYMEKLYGVFVRYNRAGDTASAEYCLNKLLSIPGMMEKVASGTDPLAYRTGNDTEMELPEMHRRLLRELAEAYPLQ